VCAGSAGDDRLSYWYATATAAYVVTTIVLALASTCWRRRHRPGSWGCLDVLHLHSEQGAMGRRRLCPQGFGGFTSELAALPSLHAGWALRVAVMVQRQGRPLMGSARLAARRHHSDRRGRHRQPPVLDVVAGWAVC